MFARATDSARRLVGHPTCLCPTRRRQTRRCCRGRDQCERRSPAERP